MFAMQTGLAASSAHVFQPNSTDIIQNTPLCQRSAANQYKPFAESPTLSRVSKVALCFTYFTCSSFACRQGFESEAQTLEAEHMQVSGQVDRTKVNIEAKQRAEDDIRRDVEIAKLGAENALVERVSTCCF